jgi:hypothetical protein
MKKVTITVNGQEYQMEMNKYYRLEFKPGFEIGDTPFLYCKAMELSFEENGNVFFMVLDESQYEDYLICDDELVSVAEVDR